MKRLLSEEEFCKIVNKWWDHPDHNSFETFGDYVEFLKQKYKLFYETDHLLVTDIWFINEKELLKFQLKEL